MDFFETPEQIAELLDEARARLKEFEEDSSSSVLMPRLRKAAPFHPTLIARQFFALFCVLAALAAAAAIAAPFVYVDLVQQLDEIDKAIGVPLFVAIGGLAACFGVAYFAAGQAALLIARECPLLPHEQRAHEKLLDDVKRLAGQKALMERVKGTPMGARARTATPSGVAPRYIDGNGASDSGPPSRVGRTPTPTPTEREYTPPWAAAQQPGSGGAAEAPAAPVRPPTRSSMGSLSTVGLAARVAAMKQQMQGENLPTVEPEEESTQNRTPPPPPISMARPSIGPKSTSKPPVTARPAADDDDDEYEATKLGNLNPRYTEPVPENAGGGFEQKYATHFPTWGAVDEPWLEDAIQKSEILATGFPVQAHLQYSAEDALPFTLVLERATPAMAVRAMVSYVEFLASIATPPRARIVLRSVPHLDRSFHRNVEAALEPYFGERAKVVRSAERIDIEFNEPDSGWSGYPRLPFG